MDTELYSYNGGICFYHFAKFAIPCLLQGPTALHAAAMQCRQDNARIVVKLLLAHGADVNAKDEKVSD